MIQKLAKLPTACRKGCPLLAPRAKFNVGKIASTQGQGYRREDTRGNPSTSKSQKHVINPVFQLFIL